MTTPSQTKPQTTKGGPLDIKDEDVVPIGTDAQLKGNEKPLDRKSDAGNQDETPPDP